MVVVRSEDMVDQVRNCFFVDTSSKQTRLSLGWISDFIKAILLYCSALAGFKAGIGFVDHVNTSLATDDFTISMAVFQGLDGGYNFHF